MRAIVLSLVVVDLRDPEARANREDQGQSLVKLQFARQHCSQELVEGAAVAHHPGDENFPRTCLLLRHNLEEVVYSTSQSQVLKTTAVIRGNSWFRTSSVLDRCQPV
mmetsp:Transcript_23592/g.54907  ORF Transcript_23592/g.54907 Transcript_23592/m.54907 type:complete len:107 (-) Transcript_23592:4112-4432(-)